MALRKGAEKWYREMVPNKLLQYDNPRREQSAGIIVLQYKWVSCEEKKA